MQDGAIDAIIAQLSKVCADAGVTFMDHKEERGHHFISIAPS